MLNEDDGEVRCDRNTNSTGPTFDEYYDSTKDFINFLCEYGEEIKEALHRDENRSFWGKVWDMRLVFSISHWGMLNNGMEQLADPENRNDSEKMQSLCLSSLRIKKH